MQDGGVLAVLTEIVKGAPSLLGRMASGAANGIAEAGANIGDAVKGISFGGGGDPEISAPAGDSVEKLGHNANKGHGMSAHTTEYCCNMNDVQMPSIQGAMRSTGGLGLS